MARGGFGRGGFSKGSPFQSRRRKRTRRTPAQQERQAAQQFASGEAEKGRKSRAQSERLRAATSLGAAAIGAGRTGVDIAKIRESLGGGRAGAGGVSGLGPGPRNITGGRLGRTQEQNLLAQGIRVGTPFEGDDRRAARRKSEAQSEAATLKQQQIESEGRGGFGQITLPGGRIVTVRPGRKLTAGEAEANRLARQELPDIQKKARFAPIRGLSGLIGERTRAGETRQGFLERRGFGQGEIDAGQASPEGIARRQQFDAQRAQATREDFLASNVAGIAQELLSEPDPVKRASLRAQRQVFEELLEGGPIQQISAGPPAQQPTSLQQPAPVAQPVPVQTVGPPVAGPGTINELFALQAIQANAGRPVSDPATGRVGPDLGFGPLLTPAQQARLDDLSRQFGQPTGNPADFAQIPINVGQPVPQGVPIVPQQGQTVPPPQVPFPQIARDALNVLQPPQPAGQPRPGEVPGFEPAVRGGLVRQPGGFVGPPAPAQLAQNAQVQGFAPAEATAIAGQRTPSPGERPAGSLGGPPGQFGIGTAATPTEITTPKLNEAQIARLTELNRQATQPIGAAIPGVSGLAPAAGGGTGLGRPSPESAVRLQALQGQLGTQQRVETGATTAEAAVIAAQLDPQEPVRDTVRARGILGQLSDSGVASAVSSWTRFFGRAIPQLNTPEKALQWVNTNEELIESAISLAETTGPPEQAKKITDVIRQNLDKIKATAAKAR